MLERIPPERLAKGLQDCTMSEISITFDCIEIESSSAWKTLMPSIDKQHRVVLNRESDDVLV